uniref:protein CASC3 n=1 Tax=Monopterus albus TaxID=43700 RepID=UPI0009B421F2|nr:protein CASC3 [Monopterus albus]
MADRRRRRRLRDSEDDDESGSGSGSDSGRSGSPVNKTWERHPDPAEATVVRTEAKKDTESECESEDGVGEAVLSDYDSADQEENGSHSEGVEEEEEAEQYSDEEAPAVASEPKPSAADGPPQGEEQGGDEEEDVAAAEGQGEVCSKEENKAEQKGNLAGERQSGDGQESTDDPETKAGGKPGQQLDDDEDRKNPAYIPRKGLFFEHDVRGHAQEEERPKGRNRKLWKDEGRWEHDKFREDEQAPKSREELIAIYGYDIRNGGGHGDRPYRQRRPRQNGSPSRDKWWKEGGERPVRSWQSGGGLNRGGAPPPSSIHPSSISPSSHPVSSAQRSSNPSRPPLSRSRPSHQNNGPPQSHYRNNESNVPQMYPRERQGPKAQSDHAGDRSVGSRGGRRGRGGPSVVIEDTTVSQGGAGEQDSSLSVVTTAASSQPGGYQSASPRRQQQEQRGSTDRSVSGLAASPSTSDPSLQSSATVTNREPSPPTERPVERKSYSLARRTRSRAVDLGSKQPSVEESATGGNATSTGGMGGNGWTGGTDGPSQAGEGGGGGGLAELDQDMARISLGGQTWSPSPTSYIHSEMRGLPNTMHIPGGPPQFSSMEEMGVGSSRAKRYSSQRQRAVPEPTAPMHLGVMEGHYYEPMSYQGPIYAHGDAPTTIPPQGMLVQPEMHIPHPGLHPHQSGGPIANPALYGGPPVSLSPGQPQQLLPPPFYPPPGVVTFPYPAIYPNPQGQSQVTYGGVTYYDTMQQQAQPKPSPPRRTSQPVTVKPPPPEMPLTSE